METRSWEKISGIAIISTSILHQWKQVFLTGIREGEETLMGSNGAPLIWGMRGQVQKEYAKMLDNAIFKKTPAKMKRGAEWLFVRSQLKGSSGLCRSARNHYAKIGDWKTKNSPGIKPSPRGEITLVGKAQKGGREGKNEAGLDF